MMPDHYPPYNNSKTYKHGELCERFNGKDIIVYRASCTNMAMQGIPLNKDSIGSFWMEEETTNSIIDIGGMNVNPITEEEADDFETGKKDYFKFLKSKVRLHW